MLTCQTEAAAIDNLFNIYNVCNYILFDYLNAYLQISPDPESEQTLMLLTSDVSSCTLPSLNVKFMGQIISRCILGKGSGLIYGKPEWTETYLLENQETVIH